MKFRCEHCGTKYSLAEETIKGRVLKIRCRQCKGVMVVRDPERSMASMESMSAADLRGYLGKSGEQPQVAPKVWYLAKGGERVGPMDAEEVRARLGRGEFSTTDYAWREGMSGWIAVRDVPELAAVPEPKGPPPVPPTVPPAAPKPTPKAEVKAEAKPKPEPKPEPKAEEKPKTKGGGKADEAKVADPLAGRQVSRPDRSAAPIQEDGGFGTMGEETRIFFQASGIAQGARRRMIIFSIIAVALAAVGAGIGMGIIPNPFGKGVDKGAFKGQALPSYVHLLTLKDQAGKTKRERSVVAAAVIENLSYQDAVIVQGWALEMMPLKDESIEIRLGRADFSKCEALDHGDEGKEPTKTGEEPAGKIILKGGDDYDCPPGQPAFRSFRGTSDAQAAMAVITKVEALTRVRDKFAEANDQINVQTYHRGQSVDAEEGRRMLECLTGGCLEAVLKDKLAAAERAVDRQMAAEARARRRRNSESSDAEFEVDEDPAAAEEARLRKASGVSQDDLDRMAALQAALGTVRLPLPTVSAPPGRATELDVKAAAKVIERGQRGITACVSRAMTRGQSMHGEMRARINIQPSGRVAGVEILTGSYKGTGVARCIVGKVKRWRFPSFPGKEIVPVEVPWKLPRR